jgi:hypothetical protein
MSRLVSLPAHSDRIGGMRGTLCPIGEGSALLRRERLPAPRRTTLRRLPSCESGGRTVDASRLGRMSFRHEATSTHPTLSVDQLKA